jgi:hypothetical protein
MLLIRTLHACQSYQPFNSSPNPITCIFAMWC